MALPRARAAMVVAHPSHELRVHGWLESARPRVLVLTDGSGRAGQPRLDWTTQVIARTGAERGGIYGRMTDLEVYAAVLTQDFDLFISLAEEMAEEFVREGIEYVAGDAVEGYNVAHEVCRLTIGAAVEMASRGGSQQIANFDFLVVGPPDDCPDELRPKSIRLCLDDEALARKLDAARSYHPKLAADVDAALNGQLFRGVRRFTEPELAAAAVRAAGDMEKLRDHPELAARVDATFGGIRIESFCEEYLRPIDNRAGVSVSQQPFYELYGERLVEAGHYKQVIRHREHMIPLADALWEHVERRG